MLCPVNLLFKSDYTLWLHGEAVLWGRSKGRRSVSGITQTDFSRQVRRGGAGYEYGAQGNLFMLLSRGGNAPKEHLEGNEIGEGGRGGAGVGSQDVGCRCCLLGAADFAAPATCAWSAGS